MAVTRSGEAPAGAWESLLLIIGGALLARLAVAALVPNAVLATTSEYEGVALSLLSGQGFVTDYYDVPHRALVHPLYPLLCAAVYWVVGQSSLQAMQVVQSAAVIPAAWLSFRLGSALAGRTAGLVAAAGVAFHPALLVFSLRRHPLWIDAILFLATLEATYGLRSCRTTRRLVIVGVLFGVAMLSRSTVAIFMGVACLWLIWQWRSPLPQAFVRVAIVVGTAALVVAPWLIRNAVVFQRPIAFVSTDGQNLWIGNNRATTGGALTADGQGMLIADPAITAAMEGLGEVERQDVYRKAALQYIASHPGTTVRNYGRKFWSFLFWSDQTGALYPVWFRAPYLVFYVMLLAAALLGGYHLARAGDSPPVVLCAGFFFSVGLLQSVFYMEGRHRWSVESALVVLAACGVVSLSAKSSAADSVEV